jgi:streptogramin lyase
VTSFTASGISQPRIITAGSDGALWFTNFNTDLIGRITTAGTVTLYHVDIGAGTLAQPGRLAAGPDGALWFATFFVNIIWRVTTSVTPGISDWPAVRQPLRLHHHRQGQQSYPVARLPRPDRHP